MMLLAMIDSIIYARNWMIGSAVICSGLLTWTAIFMLKYSGAFTVYGVLIPALNFNMSSWVVPFLLYWSEKKARYNAYLRWKGESVLLDIRDFMCA